MEVVKKDILGYEDQGSEWKWQEIDPIQNARTHMMTSLDFYFHFKCISLDTCLFIRYV